MTSRFTVPRVLDHPQRTLFGALVTAAVIGIGVWLAVPSNSDASGPHDTGGGGPKPTGISGVVYYDRNDNGRRDKGEPGIAGIRVRDKKDDVSTLTGADGAYSFADVPDSPLLQVETGWFRSLCPPVDNPTATSCPPVGKDDRFKVNNQFIQYAINGPAAGVNVGLLPDWPGGSMAVPEPAPAGSSRPTRSTSPRACPGRRAAAPAASTRSAATATRSSWTARCSTRAPSR